MSQENERRPGAEHMTRRGFFENSALAGGVLFMLSAEGTGRVRAADAGGRAGAQSAPVTSQPRLPKLDPARWIWYPSQRCLQNTFVLFRRELRLPAKPRRATGWIIADSRYLLRVNGQRIQWGPAPADPRWMEVDPVDLTDALDQGVNVIGAQVAFFGQGDGTWPMGKPGFLFRLEIETDDGRRQMIVSDSSWQAHLARCWAPGHYKRWYLRALQEEFDARLYPHGWTTSQFTPNDDWLAAMVLDCPADKPAICSTYPEYMLEMRGDPETCELRPRRIPMLREVKVPASKLTESMWIQWQRPVEEYFECRTPDAFTVDRAPCAKETAPGTWQVRPNGNRAAALTYELKEQVVGWPYFTIEAPAGTIVELMVHEAHQPGGPALLNTHFNSWTRFICREGVNHFETFDYESCRWIQLHVHNAAGPVTVRDVGVRRRIFPWPNEPRITCSEPALQRLIDASVNTLHNCAQETCVDGMGRERQQYSGDCGHQLHAIYQTFGETRLPARYLSTFSQGITLDGYFLDCWPAYDRLARLMERQLHLTRWGPLLDHGIGFNFDCMNHYLYTGDSKAIEEPYPRLLRFAEYLESIRRTDGLLPVEGLGVPSVWMDHQAYQRQRHKRCAFNLYAAAMLTHALAPLCRVFGDLDRERVAKTFGRELLAAAVRHFWSKKHGLFVNNLPWLGQEKQMRLCDRSLATAVLFDQSPGGKTEPALRALVECPAEMGFSYPANAGWRLWALAKAGRTDVILRDLRQRWATMDSVILNNTLQEDWTVRPDSGSQWSHCPLAPLYILYMSIAGIRPTAPGFTRCEIRPQLADLERLALTAHTVQGPLEFASQGRKGAREINIAMPPKCEGELVIRREEELALDALDGTPPPGHRRYRLAPGQEATFRLKYS